MFMELDLFPTPDETPILLGPVVRANRSSFRNVEIFIYLKFRAMEKVLKPSNSGCSISLSKPFSIKTGFLDFVHRPRLSERQN
jgi:hypothetical protein